MDVQVGQTVYMVRDYSARNSRREPRGVEVKVTKVGRRWATMELYGRFDMQTGLVDAGAYVSTEKVWPTKEDYEADVRLAQEWSALYRDIQDRMGCPANISVEKIEQVREILELRRRA